RFATPYDVGWGFLVNYNHDFPGKEALKKYAENVQRTPVTLEWNPEDVGKVVANNLTPGAQLTDDIAKPSDMDSVQALLEGYSYHHDWVLKDGEKVGVTAGRIISYTHNSMISIGFIRPDLAVEGNELTILWGTPGNAQFEIRATIKQYPYNSDRITSNKEYDVNTIPKRF
ncbi:MAG: aminomethyl transferase family protein, partial [Clostridia bacterium]|nr:aminomethyl transferase family protein [Clostridia bacterium]